MGSGQEKPALLQQSAALSEQVLRVSFLKPDFFVSKQPRRRPFERPFCGTGGHILLHPTCKLPIIKHNYLLVNTLQEKPTLTDLRPTTSPSTDMSAI